MYFDFVHYILQLKFFFLILESVLSSRRIVIIAAIHSHTHKSQAQELYRRFRSGFRLSTVVASFSSARTVLPVLLNCSHTFRCNYSTIHIYIHIMCYIYILVKVLQLVAILVVFSKYYSVSLISLYVFDFIFVLICLKLFVVRFLCVLNVPNFASNFLPSFKCCTKKARSEFFVHFSANLFVQLQLRCSLH